MCSRNQETVEEEAYQEVRPELEGSANIEINIMNPEISLNLDETLL